MVDDESFVKLYFCLCIVIGSKILLCVDISGYVFKCIFIFLYVIGCIVLVSLIMYGK